MSFDVDEEGCDGMIGLVPFAFCATCRVGIWEWAQISFDLYPASSLCQTCQEVTCECGDED